MHLSVQVMFVFICLAFNLFGRDLRAFLKCGDDKVGEQTAQMNKVKVGVW